MGAIKDKISQIFENALLFAPYAPKSLWCFAYPADETIEPGMCQADIPHLVYHKLKLIDHKLKCAEKCQKSCPDSDVDRYFLNPEERSECAISSYLPAPSGLIDIKFAPFCEKPHWFNSGPHRVLARISYSGDYFAVAFEEAKVPKTENVFIAAFTKNGQKKLDAKSTDDISALISAALFAKLGVILDQKEHAYRLIRDDSAEEIFAQKCEGSKWIWNF